MNKNDFLHEQQHLTDTYNKLKEVISDEYKETELPEDLKPGNANNPDEVPFILREQENFYATRKYIFERIRFLEGLLPEVYFSRMDFVDKQGKTKTYYISKTSLEALDTVDWRSEIGALYYNVTNSTYGDSKICLKRKFDISHDKLINYYDSFFSKDGNEDFTDGFLLEILRKKKYESRITDIIKTIQYEQNLIIRSKSFVNILVLGCAGSGKTMILLHRLSFLKFYSRKMNYSKVKIITPNEDFAESFKELQRDLELYDIKMMTLSGYFYNVLFNLHYVENKQNELSEYLINGDLLREIYSQNTLSIMFNEFKNNVNTTYSILDKVFNFIDSKSIKFKYNQIIDCKYSITDHLMNLRRKINEIIKSIISDISIYSKAINNINNKNLCSSFDCKTSDSILIVKKMNDLSFFNDQLSVFEKMTFSPKKFIEIYESIVSEKVKTEKQIKDSLSYLSKLNTSLENLKIKNNELDESIINIQKKVASINDEIAKLKFYNIIKKIRLNNDINNLSEKENSLRKELNKNSKSISDYSNSINNNKNNFNRLQNELVCINSNIIKLQEIYHDLEVLLKPEKQLFDIDNILEEYNSLKKTETLVEELSDLTKWYDNNFINKYINPKLKENKFRLIDQSNKYSFYYMFLLYLILTYKNEEFNEDELLCIDEFQDISLMELDLIKEINSNVVLNLYGDFNQRLLSKGTESEEQFEKHYEIFHLKNNYRNTNQITSFYNNKLNKNDNEVGVDGPDVSTISLIDFYKRQFKEEDVLICKSDDLKLFKGKSKLKIFIVEDTKGLEYNTVYVYDKNMNDNEKYIAYSRALYQLIIVTSFN